MGFNNFSSPNGYKLKWLDFQQQVYDLYNVTDIISYKFEWNYNSTLNTYDDYIIFELNEKDANVEFLKSDFVDQNISINILSSTVSAIPPADAQNFCKAVCDVIELFLFIPK